MLVALISLVVPISPAEASVPGPQRTTVVMFPWQADGKLAPQVHVGPPISGYCWTGAFPPPDDQYAWRCLSGNSILTPCFSPVAGHASEVVCAVSPWYRFAVPVIKLQRPLPLSSGDNGNYWSAWGIQLANKSRCLLANPGTPPVSGGPAAYTCAGGYLANDLNTSSEPWTVFYWSNSAEFGGPASAGNGQVEIVTVAYNGPD